MYYFSVGLFLFHIIKKFSDGWDFIENRFQFGFHLSIEFNVSIIVTLLHEYKQSDAEGREKGYNLHVNVLRFKFAPTYHTPLCLHSMHYSFIVVPHCPHGARKCNRYLSTLVKLHEFYMFNPILPNCSVFPLQSYLC